mmetsp:Transcript_8098/g.17636  ORF Transcript_8098/g.17636 Transcript_8098/m.17636 type:complete len:491 (-) Transcript_8098:222-1694(-)|eukprot:CAMPEP_0170648494 /NCGR_PEP_ID=MMETSP0224-20130122/44766_1 /TAXON_ID=285029 /ORGANISM="Togula jolla, Strain CCCM 725" /LENGTH=490 /DNA_ID=CAMNT_0010980027 /DNA_START=27 /DNA_END=1499 /DNA_ORIENTATION=-
MVRQDESKKAELELNRLQKLPDNKLCANCFGKGTPLLSAVVVPYRIFVCGTCKSAHQSFSHRCKSTQMSHWTMEEVRTLESGGNARAQERWLAHVRSTDRPKDGDSLDDFKAFVRRAYIEERWHGLDRGDGPPEEKSRQSDAMRSERRGEGQGRESRRLDDESSPASAGTPSRSSTRRAEPPANELSDLFDPNLGSVPAASTAPVPKAAASTSDSLLDAFDPNTASALFSSGSQAPAPAPAGDFGPFQASKQQGQASAAIGQGFDGGPSPFAAFGIGVDAPAQAPAEAPFDPFCSASPSAAQMPGSMPAPQAGAGLPGAAPCGMPCSNSLQSDAFQGNGFQGNGFQGNGFQGQGQGQCQGQGQGSAFGFIGAGASGMSALGQPGWNGQGQAQPGYVGGAAYGVPWQNGCGAAGMPGGFGMGCGGGQWQGGVPVGQWPGQCGGQSTGMWPGQQVQMPQGFPGQGSAAEAPKTGPAHVEDLQRNLQQLYAAS